MSFQILDIVLYGPVDEPRVVSLRPGQLNIITGSSKSGKSALIPIVDYCLGASECGVAYGPIRQTVEWYALRLLVGEQHVFVARRAPDVGHESSSEVHYQVSKTVSIPKKSELTANTNVDAAVALLSRDAGIADNLHEPPPGQTRNPLAATIRHAVSFCFQPQDEIISRNKLFFQQTNHWIEQHIHDSLPYFVGAIGDDYIVKVGRLRQLRSDYRKATQKLAELEAIRGDSVGRVRTLLQEASDLGLVDLPSDLTWVQSTELLKRVLDRHVISADERDTVGVNEYQKLVDERDELTQELRRIEEDVAGARSLMGAREGFSREGAEKAGRLRSIGLLPTTPVDASHACPLCASPLQQLPSDDALAKSLAALEQELGDVAQENPHLERLTRRLEAQTASLRGQLADNRQAIENLQQQRQQLSAYRDFLARAAHVRGRISIYLESVPMESAPSSELAEKAQRLEREIKELEDELSESAVEERLDSILSVVSQHVGDAARTLMLEHSEHRLRFNARRLIIVADTPTGPIPLAKMGSGENWVGYHIAVHLGFHRQFVTTNRPVPRFVFFDQPSQVYFPADRDTSGRLEVNREGAPVDEDRAAVLRMFTLIRDQVNEFGGAFQVVITEHADPAESWYDEAVAERWRGGVKLIPTEWISAATKAPELDDE